MDLIDRQAAIDHWRLIIDATSMDSRYNMGFVDGLEFCINHLSTMPSVQPEIIRCKECKEFRRYIDTDITFCDRTECERKPDDFCSMAERRTDE